MGAGNAGPDVGWEIGLAKQVPSKRKRHSDSECAIPPPNPESRMCKMVRCQQRSRPASALREAIAQLAPGVAREVSL